MILFAGYRASLRTCSYGHRGHGFLRIALTRCFQRQSGDPGNDAEPRNAPESSPREARHRKDADSSIPVTCSR